jgi:hypothetical protein
MKFICGVLGPRMLTAATLGGNGTDSAASGKRQTGGSQCLTMTWWTVTQAALGIRDGTIV